MTEIPDEINGIGVGDTVEITSGEMKGVEGTVVGIDECNVPSPDFVFLVEHNYFVYTPYRAFQGTVKLSERIYCKKHETRKLHHKQEEELICPFCDL